MTDESLVKDTPEKRVWLKNLYFISRILVIIAIIGMIITSILVILTGFAELFRIISFLIQDGVFSEEAGRFLSFTVTEMIDLYLIGLVLIIFSLGLYQLFIDSEIDLPEWLDTPSFDVLKARLLIVIVVVLAVLFLGYASTATNGIVIAGLGIGISLVIIAIGYILSIASRGQIERKKTGTTGTRAIQVIPLRNGKKSTPGSQIFSIIPGLESPFPSRGKNTSRLHSVFHYPQCDPYPSDGGTY
jgi:uncharacterized membrane protein YqhA